jgi:glutathione S-transferase
MQLFVSPGTCSQSPLIALHEAGLDAEIVRVNLGAKTYGDGADFLAISPNGYVPALRLDDGTVLVEGPAIVQYLADLAPATAIAPANGTIARYQLQAWLNQISTELHKGFSPLFTRTLADDVHAHFRARLRARFETVDAHLAGRDYLLGDGFSVADSYLFVVASWARFVALDLSDLANLQATLARVGARPAVQAALAVDKALRTRV